MGFLPSHLAVAIAIEIRMEHREVKLRVRGNMWGPACVGAGSFWSSLRRALLGKTTPSLFPSHPCEAGKNTAAFLLITHSVEKSFKQLQSRSPSLQQIRGREVDQTEHFSQTDTCCRCRDDRDKSQNEFEIAASGQRITDRRVAVTVPTR